MQHLLLLDVNYLCHRAYHTTGHLEFEGIVTGVLYGVLRDIRTLQENLQGEPVFCFDKGPSKRKLTLPTYKGSRQARERK